MQASKIIVGNIYAIQQGEALARFKVTSVTTTRKGASGSPHDYSSSVAGDIDARDITDGSNEARTLRPDQILGPYEEYATLAEKKKAEQAAAEAVKQARKAKQNQLVALLCQISGVDLPVEYKLSYTRLEGAISPYFDNDIRITEAAWDKVIAALERVVATKERAA